MPDEFDAKWPALDLFMDAFWPVPDRSGRLTTPPDAGFVDPFAANDAMSAMVVSPPGR
jgi:hypothetical protein